MRIYLTFHISKVKPVVESPLVPVVSILPPPHIIDSELAYTVKKLAGRSQEGTGQAVPSGLERLWSRGEVLGFRVGSWIRP